MLDTLADVAVEWGEELECTRIQRKTTGEPRCSSVFRASPHTPLDPKTSASEKEECKNNTKAWAPGILLAYFLP